MQPDYSNAYESTRLRITELARSLSDEELARRVPATPDWTAKDLIAHMVGVAADVTTGTVQGVGSAAWTETQVSRRRGMPVEEVLAEWEALAPEIAGGLNLLPRTMSSMFVGDLVTHEHDLRGGVGRPGARDTEEVEVALDTYAFRFRRKLEKEGLPHVVVSNGTKEWRGEGEPGATVSGGSFELLRALTGRRTPAEIQSNLAWTGDAERYLPLVPLYGIPETSLNE
jgi:uncharacterized protein (TIGR03083 family)